MATRKQSHVAGFTLVELSIVLVIIGLIIGGLLVGQDLVRNAENRAIISQIDKYNAAVNSFRTKFNAIPGDFAQAASYIAWDGTTNVVGGDGNGILATGAGTTPTAITGEYVQFWYQLSQLGMVDGNYNGTTGAVVLGTNFPLAKSNRGGIFAYGFSDSINYYHIGLAPSATATIATAGNLTPDSALLIDVKVDDGKANSGVVTAKGGTLLEVVASDSALGTAGGCVVTGSLAIYNTSNTGYLCQLRVRFI